MRYERDLPTPADTTRLGEQIGKALFPGAVVGLVGPLGAGKTTMVQAIAGALGAERKLVSSPTFALIHEYPARLPLYHFDTYRLSNAAAFQQLGLDEYFFGTGVCLIEWADRFPETLPKEMIWIDLEYVGTGRRAVLESSGQQYNAIIQTLAAKTP